MIARFVGAALLSGGVTFGLFFLMQYLILGEEWKPSEKKGGQISIVRDVRESDTQTKRRLPQQVKQEAPPPPPKMQIQQSSKPQTGLDMGGMISAANMQMGGGPTLGEGAAARAAHHVQVIMVQPARAGGARWARRVDVAVARHREQVGHPRRHSVIVDHLDEGQSPVQ